MSNRIYMVPAPGLRILYPRGGPHAGRVLPESGAYFPGRADADGVALAEHYWQRRADEGSILLATPPDADAPIAAPLSPAKGKKGVTP